jgi:hypothetical protein
MIRTLCIALILSLLVVPKILSQDIYLTPSHEVYDFLKRMEAKRLLVDYKDAAKPLSRMVLAQMLKTLETHVQEMTRVEQETYAFLSTEFKYELLKLSGDSEPTEIRWHLLSTEVTKGILNFDINYRQGRSYTKGEENKYRTQGIKLYGYAFDEIGFYFNWVDSRESGKNINLDRQNTPEPGIILNGGVITPDYSTIDHNENDVQFTWHTGSFTFSLEKNVNVWGYGKNGNVILSNKAPSYPQIKMRVPLSKNIDFIYFHGELNSNELDSSRSYFYYPHLTNDSLRRVDKQKYIAAHMIDISLFKGVELSIGESVIYSDRGPLLIYLIPISMFKAAEWYNGDKDNVQLFGSLDLNVIKNVNMYFSLFIDELNTDKLFDPDKSHRQLAFTAGFHFYEIPTTNFDLTTEYTRANPYVYNHKFSATTFTNNGYDLGDWIGQNADDLYLELGYTPMHALRLSVFSEVYRKGAKGSILDQYSEDQGKKPFLFDLQYEERSFGLIGRYQPVRDVFIDFRAKVRKIKDTPSPNLNQNNQVEFYVSAGVGLW